MIAVVAVSSIGCPLFCWTGHARQRLRQRVGVGKTDYWRRARLYGRYDRYWGWRWTYHGRSFVLVTIPHHERWVVVSVWPLTWWQDRLRMVSGRPFVHELNPEGSGDVVAN